MINANEARVATLNMKTDGQVSDFMQELQIFWQNSYLNELKSLIEEKTNYAIRRKETYESCVINENDINNHYLSKANCLTTIKLFLENLGYKVVVKDEETIHPLIKWSW